CAGHIGRQDGDASLDRLNRYGSLLPAPYSFSSRSCFTSPPASAENVADIGAAGQVTHSEPQPPALKLEIRRPPPIPIALPWFFGARATVSKAKRMRS